MAYIDDTLKQAILDEVIGPNIKTVALLTLNSILEEFQSDEKQTDNLRKIIVEGTLDIVTPLVTKAIDQYDEIMETKFYIMNRDIEYLKSMMINYGGIALGGPISETTSNGMVGIYSEFCKEYNEEHKEDFDKFMALIKRANELRRVQADAEKTAEASPAPENKTEGD